MNKVDMLDAINEKKQQVIDLVNADKLDEAKEAKKSSRPCRTNSTCLMISK